MQLIKRLYKNYYGSYIFWSITFLNNTIILMTLFYFIISNFYLTLAKFYQDIIEFSIIH